ncbi:DNA-binding protein [Burkholderia sp. THE68]|uniref:helix-turn-helix transcriptional regulator n=1 Tax=Burkholderia sp. THE68 TaxID=758782 RepID=UPI0013163B0B|nr:DNA-binding protein [Burkholderia sp. THE68]BBU26985.1 DNA-binding protein [Burkholderia sp. THE68]
MEYVFTLKYQLSAEDCDHEQLVERLAEAGCDDATIGIGQPGRIALAFKRADVDAFGAILSALQNVKQAIPSARLIEAAPDFVGLTDVAEVTGMTRQNMRKLMLANAMEFPAPVHEGNPSVWHLSDILAWLKGRGGYRIDAELLDVSRTAKQVNLAKEAREIEPDMTQELDRLVA